MESVEDRIARLEQQVAELQRHLGLVTGAAGAASDGPALPPEFHAALRDGKTVKAIKIYRQATGASLVVAKRAVEAIQRRSALER
ncbi:hypothetical protein MF672_025035 [Actinomadura sp. ATCC 31491]|uniref:Ribosomal protein L7/L12 C-terminal domain-containing protein n=1 Tax=Actinomadura luzonensis TaxID=2805427 RepID=A0ABT0FXH1_9ACTN|nr:hypothetical protein [Actinomadura luzonensis]MCK2217031.1 hypothetical protein [Actinomadura luzonensis]